MLACLYGYVKLFLTLLVHLTFSSINISSFRNQLKLLHVDHSALPIELNGQANTSLMIIHAHKKYKWFWQKSLVGNINMIVIYKQKTNYM